MTTEPQWRDPTKKQKRLAKRQATFDAMMRRSGSKPDPESVKRPGSPNK